MINLFIVPETVWKHQLAYHRKKAIPVIYHSGLITIDWIEWITESGVHRWRVEYDSFSWNNERQRIWQLLILPFHNNLSCWFKVIMKSMHRLMT